MILSEVVVLILWRRWEVHPLAPSPSGSWGEGEFQAPFLSGIAVFNAYKRNKSPSGARSKTTSFHQPQGEALTEPDLSRWLGTSIALPESPQSVHSYLYEIFR
jgi:hypothetical protein